MPRPLMFRSLCLSLLACTTPTLTVGVLAATPAVAQSAARSATEPAAGPAAPNANADADADIRIDSADSYFLGQTPAIAISGLAPGAVARVHMLRTVTIWDADGFGGWRPDPRLMHGWGEYRADASGRIALATAHPTAGSTLASGPASLLWSAFRAGDPALAAVAFAAAGPAASDAALVRVRVTQGDAIVAEREFRLGAERPDMTRVEIISPGLVGVFAAPAGARGLPTIIHLHGSEGGSIAKARSDAQRYAEQGFATLALAYFAWPFEGEGLGLPDEHRNIPVELLDRARAWLAARSEADVSRIALVGNSKGGEFAMLGAAVYPWVRAAVGCVPSDVVWEGYGAVAFDGGNARNVPAAGTYSSWSLAGQALPYIPTFADRPYIGDTVGFIDNSDRYDRARALQPDAGMAARIPIERTAARLYLIGGDRDRTWASGSMVRSLANAMAAAGRGAQVETLIDPVGGHSLCGDGLFPHRAYQVQSADRFAPLIDAQGASEVAAHDGKIAFLRRALE